MKRKLILNSFSNILDFLVTVVITLLMTPLYLRFLGHYDYGLWEMIIALVGYMGLLDLGLRSSVIRNVSVLTSQGKHEQVNVLYATALFYMTSIGVLQLLFFLGWAMIFPESLGQYGEVNGKYQQLLMLIGCSAFLAFVRSTAEGALEGKQLYIIKNFINLFIKTCVAIFLYHNLNEENGILILTSTVVVASLSRVVAFNILLFTSKYPINPIKKPSYQVFLQLLKFGLKSLLNGAALAVQQASGVFLIGVLLSPAAIPLYSITKALPQYVISFVERSSSVLMPYFAEQSVGNDVTVNNHTFLFCSKIIVWFLCTALCFIIVFGADFVDIWLDGQFNKSQVQMLLILFSVTILVERINPLAVRLSTALNKHGIFARLRPIGAVGVFISSYFLIQFSGIQGAIYANFAMALILTPVFMRHTFNLVHITMGDYFVKCLAYNGITLIVLLTLVIGYKQVFEVDEMLGLLGAFSFTALTGLLLLLTCVLDSNEQKTLHKMILRFLKQS